MHDASLVEEVVDMVLRRHYVIEEGWHERTNPWSRNALYYALSGGVPPDVQKKLQQKSALILGCGGIGNLVGVSLATSGIGKITLLDFDTIEVSNLTRQFMFTKDDVGKSKAEVLKEELLKRSHCVKVETIDSPISKELLESLPKPDLIVLSADSVDSLPTVNAFAIENKVAYINIGYVQDIAVFGPFVIPGQTGCVYCQDILAGTHPLNQQIKDKINSINKTHQAPSNPAVNMLASSLGLMDILKYLGEFGEIQSLNRRIGLWTHSLKLEVQECHKNPDCDICSHC